MEKYGNSANRPQSCIKRSLNSFYLKKNFYIRNKKEFKLTKILDCSSFR